MDAPNQGSFIKIQQSPRHDVWNIQKKNDGTYAVKKVNEDGAAAATGEHAKNSGPATSTANATNTMQLGARPKTTFNQNLIMSVESTSKKLPCTLNAVSLPETKLTANRIIAPAIYSATVKAKTTPEGGGIFVKQISPPKKEVITINTTAAPKKEFVITINTTKSPKNEVITLNTTCCPTKQPVTLKAEPVITTNQADAQNQGTSNVAQANASFIELEQQLKHSIQNIKENPTGRQQMLKSDGTSQHLEKNDEQNESGRATLSGSPIIYSDQACRLQEMFPEIPLDVISNDLMVSGSVEATIDNILEGKVVAPPKPPSRSAVVQSENKAFALPSLKTEDNELKTKKKGGSVIKIELLSSNEVWNIKKKENEGFVMKKVGPENEAQCQSSTSVNEEACVNSWTEDMDECDDILSADDMFIGDTPYKANPQQVNGPVKLMVFGQSSSKQSPVPKRRAIAAVPFDENDKSLMEVDDDEHLYPEKNALMESFVFSDDENEESVTFEHILFKASLKFKKFQCINETKNPNPLNPELLNIKGDSEGEKGSVAEGVPSGKGSDPDVAERGIKSEEGSNASVVQQGTISEKGSCTVMSEDCSDEYYSDYDDE